MANTYNEESGASMRVLEFLVGLSAACTAIATSLPLTIWVPYTIFSGSLYRDGGWRVLIILWMVGIGFVNRHLANSDFIETNPGIDWLEKHAGAWTFLLLFVSWQLMMFLPTLVVAIADPGFVRESLEWFVNLIVWVWNDPVF